MKLDGREVRYAIENAHHTTILIEVDKGTGRGLM